MTVKEALEELKGRQPLFFPEVKEPSAESISKVVDGAKTTGDLEKLSTTDIKLLALALEEKAVLVTDDFAMQNVAEFLGIKWEAVEGKGIKEKVRWIFKCKSCGKVFERYPGGFCPVCGGKIVRKRAERVKIQK